MKKKMFSLLVIAGIALGGCSSNENEVGVKDAHGFKVLDIPSEEHYSTIACESFKDEYTAKGELKCRNLFDKDDVVHLDKKDAKKFEEDERLLVTFFHDSVDKVEKNKYSFKN